MMEIPNDLKGEIWDYCRANNITNIDEFTLKLLKQGFTSEKFGSTPMIKTIEKEVEKIVEVEVEKIVEKIVEVPVNMVDTELSDKYTELIKSYESLQSEVEKLKVENVRITKELGVETQKNKKDIYGEG
ncbi:MAG: hypothetical protein WCK82_07980 [Bacteroidota bacterium]